MRAGFLVPGLHDLDGIERSVATQANALVAAGHDVTILCVERRSAEPPFEIDPAVRVGYLIDLVDPDAPRVAGVTDDRAARLMASPSLLVPEHWDDSFTALTDVGLQQGLSGLHVDVLVTVTPALLAAAVQLLPDGPAIVHQEHGVPDQEPEGNQPLVTFGPRADAIVVLTAAMADWVTGTLGPLATTTEVVPNPLPHAYAPRSTLDTRLIVSAGSLTPEKGHWRLLHAFAEIADRVPDWRLRIIGIGGQRIQLVRRIRRLGLYDRVELPGQSLDMASEWARGSVAALSSRYDASPRMVQEAMAAGLPVAAFDSPFGTREAVRHEVDGLLAGTNSISGLASALLRLATDDALRHRLGQGAFETSAAFAPAAIAERWVDILQAAIDRRAGAPSRLVARTSELPEHAAAPTLEVRAPADLTPAAARTLILDWAVSCARQASDFWFVQPPQDDHTPVLVVPMRARDDFLAALSGAGAPPALSLVDSSDPDAAGRRGPLTELAGALIGRPSARVSIEPWPTWEGTRTLLAQGCRVDVEFWEPAPDGQLVAPGIGRYTNQVAPDVALVPHRVEGVEVRTLPVMAMPTVHDCTFPIDAVYTWVDGSDPAWNAAREARLAQETGTARTRASSGHARFVSRDELRYSLRSVHLFAPWIRKIFLVTAGQVPPWLVDHPQVQVVDHAEILPADGLPVFNSHAIESSLHKIPDLAEHFVYLNDDFLLGRPLRPQNFFTAAGQTAVFLSRTNLGLDDTPGQAAWLHAAHNNRRLLQQEFGVTTTSSLVHAPYAHRRSVLAEIEQRFPDEIARTSRSPFRSDTDVSMLSSLAQHYGLITGTAVLREAAAGYVDVSSSLLPWRLRGLLEREQDFICLGDHHDHALKPDLLQRMLHEFFETYCPVPAPWEAPPA